jgi:hypothetical protein
VDTVLENNGEVAIVRGNYKPLIDKTVHVWSDEIGQLWQICRYDWQLYPTPESFLAAFPVGAQINRGKEHGKTK